jgi:anti-sigma28 factor (negative regulator of flagellin synthesis)
MPDISSVGPGGVGPSGPGASGQVGPIDRVGSPDARYDDTPARALGRPPERPGDRVELSDHARLLDHLRHLPETRQSRVEEIREAIRAGTYESPEKLDAAISNLLREI